METKIAILSILFLMQAYVNFEVFKTVERQQGYMEAQEIAIHTVLNLVNRKKVCQH